MKQDPAAIVRSAFPAWRSDPYQKTALDALLRILFAGEKALEALEHVDDALAWFVQDPPFSLSFGAPAAQAERLALRLEALAHELRKGVKRLRSLDAYVGQFSDASPSISEGAHDGEVRPEAVRDRGPQTGPAYGDPPF